MDVRDDAAVKGDLRRRMAAARDAMAADERSRLSERICRMTAEQALLPLQRRIGRPPVVCVYAAFRSEADPAALADWCLAHGCRVAAPRIRRSGDGLELRLVGSAADWTAGRWGVPEPDPERTALVPARELDAVIVPGLAFDRRGGRIGYGGGYYDRLYAELSGRAAGSAAGRPVWIGFGFAGQVTEERLPAEPHDLRLDGLATERGVEWFE